MNTVAAGRPSITMTMLSRASSIRRTGPIGMQPWVNPVATETAGDNISPAIGPQAVLGRGLRKEGGGTAVRYEAADEKGAARCRSVDRGLRQVGAARVGMD